MMGGSILYSSNSVLHTCQSNTTKNLDSQVTDHLPSWTDINNVTVHLTSNSNPPQLPQTNPYVWFQTILLVADPL